MERCFCVCHARQFPANNGNFARGNYQNMCILNALDITPPSIGPASLSADPPVAPNPLLPAFERFQFPVTVRIGHNGNIHGAHKSAHCQQNQKAPEFSFCAVTCDSAVRKHEEHFVMVVIGVFVVCFMSGFKLPSNLCLSLSLCSWNNTHVHRQSKSYQYPAECRWLCASTLSVLPKMHMQNSCRYLSSRVCVRSDSNGKRAFFLFG